MNIKFYCLLAIVLVSLNSCKSTKDASSVKFGFLIHSLEKVRWNNDVAYIKQRSKEKGFDVIVKDAGGSAQVQVEQAKELLEQDVDVLVVVAANQNSAAQIVRMANDNDTPIIAYDRLIQNCDLDYIVSFDYYKVGEMMANYAFSKVKSGNIVFMYGDSNDANAIMVKDGIYRVYNDGSTKSNYNLIFEDYVEGWSYDVAKYDFTKVVKYFTDPIDIVLACNTSLALAVKDVLIENNRNPEETIITAQDFSVDLGMSIKNNEVNMTVQKPLKDLAFGLVDLIEKIYTNDNDKGINGSVNNRQKDVDALLFEPFIVDQKNIDQYLKN